MLQEDISQIKRSKIKSACGLDFWTWDLDFLNYAFYTGIIFISVIASLLLSAINMLFHLEYHFRHLTLTVI
jgi:hypothetical protein